MPNTIIAATFLLLAVLHSVLGERLLLAPLRSSPLPPMPIGRWLGGRTLRFAWHATSVAWLALGAVVLEPSKALGVASLALGFSGAVGAVVCLARVVGDARLVGLFKRVRGTPFATWDDLLFTPLSFSLALCFAVVAAGPA